MAAALGASAVDIWKRGPLLSLPRRQCRLAFDVVSAPCPAARTVFAASCGFFLARLAHLHPAGWYHQARLRRRIRRYGLPRRGGVSRWLLASRGTPNQEDDPDGELKAEASKLWLDLEPKLMYLPRSDRVKALSGLCVAVLAHKGQKRKSGEPYIIHPVAVAELLADLKVEVDVVIAGLLHDTVEDNDEINFRDLEVIFGRDVRRIVEGETKASKRTALGRTPAWSRHYAALFDFVVFGKRPWDSSKPKSDDVSKARLQAENLRDMFLAMADDYRVILVKLADRLHNMRTLQHMPERKRFSIAGETLAVFAPLAHRLGVWLFKTELEDLSFKFLYPNDFTRLDKLLSMRRAQYSSTLSSAARDFSDILRQSDEFKEQNVRVSITGREKGMYSLWHKMQLKPKYENNIDNIDDIIALRVVLDIDKTAMETESEYQARGNKLCYRALSLAYSLPNWTGGDAVKDYISYPKPNGYRSLHVVFVHHDVPVPLEIQIRTRQMHEVAEYGMAAHWAYKDQQHGEQDKSDMANRRVAWLATLADKDGADPQQFVQEVLREELGKRCFVFLRDGKILNLSSGCSVLDAAFKIHTEVGMRMVYPEVNGVRVPPFYALQNGDRVNIVTSPESKPKQEWLAYAFLRSTRGKLAAHFRKRKKEEDAVVDLAAALATAATAVAAFPHL
eukprot:TRINITY_DN90677_c0_g1_i1.p1 TRINITY_DN90677_c0_g1~~TRINITY_DN90677_c0_g1_i1.p1  ORF type:complete len:691 (-),score=126.62 TRINITY_DN90677_c0_g1_i1:166-2190(-)